MNINIPYGAYFIVKSKLQVEITVKVIKIAGILEKYSSIRDSDSPLCATYTCCGR